MGIASLYDTYSFFKQVKREDKANKAAAAKSAIDNKVRYPTPGAEHISNPYYTVTITQYGDQKSPTIVRAYMPDDITFDFSSEFSTPFAEIGGAIAAFNNATKAFGGKIGANILSMQVWDGSSPLELTLPLRFVAFTDTNSDVVEKIRRLTAMSIPSADTPGATNSQIASIGYLKSPGPRIKFGTGGGLKQAGEQVVEVTKTTGSAIKEAGVALAQNLTGQALVDFLGSLVKEFANGINGLLELIEIENRITVRLGAFSFLECVVIRGVGAAYNVKCDKNGNWIDATVDVRMVTFLNPLTSDIPNLIGYGTAEFTREEGSSNYPGASKQSEAVATTVQSTATNPSVDSAAATELGTTVSTNKRALNPVDVIKEDASGIVLPESGTGVITEAE